MWSNKYPYDPSPPTTPSTQFFFLQKSLEKSSVQWQRSPCHFKSASAEQLFRVVLVSKMGESLKAEAEASPSWGFESQRLISSRRTQKSVHAVNANPNSDHTNGQSQRRQAQTHLEEKVWRKGSNKREKRTYVHCSETRGNTISGKSNHLQSDDRIQNYHGGKLGTCWSHVCEFSV